MRVIFGQTWCSWCGASFGEPMHSRQFVIDGARVRVVYPSGIEYHDILRRSQGGDPLSLDNQCPLCVSCHKEQHSSRPFTIEGDTITRGSTSVAFTRGGVLDSPGGFHD